MEMTLKKAEKYFSNPGDEINPGEHAYYGGEKDKVYKVFIIQKKDTVNSYPYYNAFCITFVVFFIRMSE